MRNVTFSFRILPLIVLFNLLLTTKALDYSCRPNGTFVINNPDSTKYRMVEVQDEMKKCSTTTFSDDYTTLQIDGCLKDRYVTLVLIKSSAEPLLLTKDDFLAFKIMCRGLPPEDIVSMSLVVSEHVEEIGYAERTEITRVFSFVEESDPIPLVTVSMKDQLEWIMEVKDNHSALPVSCAAYPGRIVTDVAERLVLIENGCSIHDEVMPLFSRVPNADGSNTNRFLLQFNAFRINSDPFISVVCDMMICTGPKETGCQSNCNSRRRRRGLRRRHRDPGRLTTITLMLEVLYEKTDLQDSGQGNGHTERGSKVPTPS